jgi:hypothetical protein
MLSTKFQFIWESGFKGEDFFRNQKQIIFFPILGWARAGCAPLWIRPCKDMSWEKLSTRREVKMLCMFYKLNVGFICL